MDGELPSFTAWALRTPQVPPEDSLCLESSCAWEFGKMSKSHSFPCLRKRYCCSWRAVSLLHYVRTAISVWINAAPCIIFQNMPAALWPLLPRSGCVDPKGGGERGHLQPGWAVHYCLRVKSPNQTLDFSSIQHKRDRSICPTAQTLQHLQEHFGRKLHFSI